MTDKKIKITTEMIKLDGTIIKSDGSKFKSDFFKFLELNPDDYSDVSYTPEEARKIKSHLLHLSTGAAAAVPMICGGVAKCPVASRCPFVRIDKERIKAQGSGCPKVTPVGRACHPAGSLITTSNRGMIPIEDLNVYEDKVVTYHQKSNFFPKLGKQFKLGHRFYDGNLIKIKTKDLEYECTSDHITIARWNKKAKDLFAVYLMKKGPYFRVGRTQLFLNLKIGHNHSGLAYRGRAEKAECMWLLGLYETVTEAHMAEEYFSLKGQVPKVCFLAAKTCTNKSGFTKWATQDDLDRHHEKVKKPSLHWERFLSKEGLDIKYPVWEYHKKTMFGGMERTMEIRACNLIGKYMSVPCIVSNPEINYHGCNKPEWKQIEITSKKYVGIVFSLEVDGPWLTYIVNKIVTHNCLVEIELMNEWTRLYLFEYDVAENAFTEIQMCRELAEVEILLWRINNGLAKPENAELVQEVIVGVDKKGNALTRIETNALFEAKERLQNRKLKLIKLMVGDRQEKYKREAALKVRDVSDPSTQTAQLRGRLTRLLDEAKTVDLKIKEKEGDIIDVGTGGGPMTPEDLISGGD